MKKLVRTWENFLHSAKGLWLNDLGLLFARLAFAGTLLVAHGWSKLADFEAKSATFPDPLGVGSTMSLGLATFAEFFCALAIVVGLGTRLAVLPLIPTMLIAANVANSGKAGAGELALLYLFGFVTLLFTGPGRISLDHFIKRKLVA